MPQSFKDFKSNKVNRKEKSSIKPGSKQRRVSFEAFQEEEYDRYLTPNQIQAVIAY